MYNTAEHAIPTWKLCDFYLFDAPRGKAVMTMTVNPDMGLSDPDTLHPEGLYAFRFDLNGIRKDFPYYGAPYTAEGRPG